METITEKSNVSETQDLGKFDEKGGNEAIDDLILQPFTYITSVPGKRIRMQLLEMLQQWLPVPEEKAKTIETVMHVIHNGSLLIDDIQDGSALRRGIPAAHAVFGITNTVIAADYLMCYILDSVLDLNMKGEVKKYYNLLIQMSKGQGMEIYWRENLICPTEEEYLEMVYRKTAIVFLIGKNLMEAVSGKNVDSDKLIKTLGVYFQINDDYQNLRNPIYHQSKGFCEDITEGKFSFPIVHAVNNYPKEGEIIKGILGERTTDVKTKEYCLSLLEQCGSFEYTKNKLKEMKDVIDEEIAKLPENPLINDFIKNFMITSL